MASQQMGMGAKMGGEHGGMLPLPTGDMTCHPCPPAPCHLEPHASAVEDTTNKGQHLLGRMMAYLTLIINL